MMKKPGNSRKHSSSPEREDYGNSKCSVCCSTAEVSPQIKQKRTIKNKYQINILKSEFKKNSKWGEEVIDQIAEVTGLDRSQVRKWNWDYAKKKKSKYSNCNIKLTCNESLKISMLEKDVLCLQTDYKKNFSGFFFKFSMR
jgi:Homeodomain